MLEYALKQERFVMFFFSNIAFLFIFFKTLYNNVSFVNISELFIKIKLRMNNVSTAFHVHFYIYIIKNKSCTVSVNIK